MPPALESTTIRGKAQEGVPSQARGHMHPGPTVSPILPRRGTGQARARRAQGPGLPWAGLVPARQLSLGMLHQGLGPRAVEGFSMLASCLICVLTGLFLLERRRS